MLTSLSVLLCQSLCEGGSKCFCPAGAVSSLFLPTLTPYTASYAGVRGGQGKDQGSLVPFIPSKVDVCRTGMLWPIKDFVISKLISAYIVWN